MLVVADAPAVDLIRTVTRVCAHSFASSGLRITSPDARQNHSISAFVPKCGLQYLLQTTQRALQQSDDTEKAKK